jgi:hypothetical protein
MDVPKSRVFQQPCAERYAAVVTYGRKARVDAIAAEGQQGYHGRNDSLPASERDACFSRRGASEPQPPVCIGILPHTESGLASTHGLDPIRQRHTGITSNNGHGTVVRKNP